MLKNKITGLNRLRTLKRQITRINISLYYKKILSHMNNITISHSPVTLKSFKTSTFFTMSKSKLNHLLMIFIYNEEQDEINIKLRTKKLYVSSLCFLSATSEIKIFLWFQEVLRGNIGTKLINVSFYEVCHCTKNEVFH